MSGSVFGTQCIDVRDVLTLLDDEREYMRLIFGENAANVDVAVTSVERTVTKLKIQAR